jgi:hypothetical protein
LPDSILEEGFSAGFIDLESSFTGKNIQELSSIFRVEWTPHLRNENKKQKKPIDRSASTGYFRHLSGSRREREDMKSRNRAEESRMTQVEKIKKQTRRSLIELSSACLTLI